MASSLLLTSIFAFAVTFSAVKPLDYYDIKVNTKTCLHVVDERYLSYAMDCGIIKNGWETFDFGSKRLNFLAKSLAPAYFRFGGTPAESLFFDEYPPKTKKTRYPQKKDFRSNLQDDNANFTMTKNDWNMLNRFVQGVGWRLWFDLNALIRNGTLWDLTNARKLLMYTLDKDYAANIDFELGNEPTWYYDNFKRSITSQQCGNDYLQLRELLEKEPFQTVYSKAKLVGPAVVGSIEHTKKFLGNFLEVVKRNISAMTYHHYYMNEKVATVDKFIDPNVMDSLLTQINGFQTIRDQVGLNNLTIWIGETSTAYGGGALGLSNRYVAGFLFLDKLGLSAKHGVAVVTRQTFYGHNYSLIDEDLYPLPDYWLTLLYKRLVGRRVLNVSLSAITNSVRAYAHCTQESGTGSVTVYVLNVLPTPAVLSFSDELGKSNLEEYLLTPYGKDGLKSKFVALNGKKLELIDDTTFPELKPRIYQPGLGIILPSKSFAFYVFPNAKATVCL